MKIAFLTHEPFYPPSGGGSAEALYLVREMVRRGHQVEIFCPNIQAPAEVEREFGVRLREFKSWEMGRYSRWRTPKYLIYPFFLQRMVQRAAAHRPFDLIFSQHAIAAVAAGRLKRALGIPVTMNFLDFLTGFMETWPSYLAPPPMLARLKRFELCMPRRYCADGVLTVSDTLADYFAASGFSRERIQPIYYGYDAELFPYRGSAAGPGHPPTLIMHGSLDYHHLREIALESTAYVVEHRPEVRLKIVGHRTAALDQFLRQLARRSPAARVECTGFVPYPEIAGHLSSADIGIVPYEESVGTHCAFVAKIVEYLGIGLPVVSTRLQSASRYFSQERMIRFSDFNGVDFGKRILEWLTAPLHPWEPFARAASERVRRELDWRTIAAKAVDFAERSQRRATGEASDDGG